MNKTKILHLLKDSSQLSKGGLSLVLFLSTIGGEWGKSQRDLTLQLPISQRQLSDVLNELERQGYIERIPHPMKGNKKILRLKGGQDGR